MRKAFVFIGLIIALVSAGNLQAQIFTGDVNNMSPENQAAYAILMGQLENAENTNSDDDKADIMVNIVKQALEANPGLADALGSGTITLESGQQVFISASGSIVAASNTTVGYARADTSTVTEQTSTSSIPEPEATADIISNFIADNPNASDAQIQSLIDTTVNLVAQTDGGEDTANEVARLIVIGLREQNVDSGRVAGIVEQLNNNDNVTTPVTSSSSTTATASLL